MNRADAEALALKITQTWRSSPTQTIWCDVLADLHTNQAEAAYRQLRNEAEQTPTIARFLNAYRALNQHHGPDGPNGCHYCDGYGWISTTFERHGHEYSASAACTNCLAGKDAQRTVTWCHNGGAA